MDIATFFDMGGYAAFVWPGYGIVALAIVALLLFTRRTLKAREQEFTSLRRNRRAPDDNS